MKKELLAAALLLTLCLGAWLNLRRIGDLTAACEVCLERSESALILGDGEAALSAFRDARSLWDRARAYTGIFLSRRDLDGVENAFFLVEEQLLSGAAEGAPARYSLLRRCLRDLAAQERLTAENLLARLISPSAAWSALP